MNNQPTMCDCLGCAVGGACCTSDRWLGTQNICTVPPPGWYCTRVAGHDGPCAAHPVDTPSQCCTVAGTLLNPAPATAQERFEATYISSLEVGERLGVSRPAVMHARRTGKLPEPVCVNGGQIYIWERAEVEPYLAAWEMSVRLRRGEQVVAQRGPGNPFLEPLRVDE